LNPVTTHHIAARRVIKLYCTPVAHVLLLLRVAQTTFQKEEQAVLHRQP
jgi:hypothetical protein